MKSRWLISKCLLGIPCRYDGCSISNKHTNAFHALIESGSIAVCPEELGELPTPRPQSEIQNASGLQVIENSAKIKNIEGMDVTGNFILGAQKTLEIAQKQHLRRAIFKSRSPSCGCGEIYDGTFSGKLISGDGVTTALLKKNQITVISDENYLSDIADSVNR